MIIIQIVFFHNAPRLMSYDDGGIMSYISVTRSISIDFFLNLIYQIQLIDLIRQKPNETVNSNLTTCCYFQTTPHSHVAIHSIVLKEPCSFISENRLLQQQTRSKGI